jgi:hypothetical protein
VATSAPNEATGNNQPTMQPPRDPVGHVANWAAIVSCFVGIAACCVACAGLYVVVFRPNPTGPASAETNSFLETLQADITSTAAARSTQLKALEGTDDIVANLTRTAAVAEEDVAKATSDAIDTQQWQFQGSQTAWAMTQSTAAPLPDVLPSGTSTPRPPTLLPTASSEPGIQSPVPPSTTSSAASVTSTPPRLYRQPCPAHRRQHQRQRRRRRLQPRHKLFGHSHGITRLHVPT